MTSEDVPLVEMVPEVLENDLRVLERVPAIFKNVPEKIKVSLNMFQWSLGGLQMILLRDFNDP